MLIIFSLMSIYLIKIDQSIIFIPQLLMPWCDFNLHQGIRTFSEFGIYYSMLRLYPSYIQGGLDRTYG